jgi:hypothetical protein
VAPPIVSADGGSLTKLFILDILAEANERAMVTAKGRPSGIATTMTVIAIMTALRASRYTLFLRSVKSYPTHPSNF